jgi:hypothetical protein
MRGLFLILLLVLGLPATAGAGWYGLGRMSPGEVGTPAHAGVISNGRPEECTTVNLSVRARSTTEHRLFLGEDQVLRGTFEANGGFGGVDIMMRIVTPRGGEALVSPRDTNYDFVLIAEIPGEYTFVFDNRYSMVTAKAIGLYYCVPE